MTHDPERLKATIAALAAQADDRFIDLGRALRALQEIDQAAFSALLDATAIRRRRRRSRPDHNPAGGRTRVPPAGGGKPPGRLPWGGPKPRRGRWNRSWSLGAGGGRSLFAGPGRWGTFFPFGWCAGLRRRPRVRARGATPL